MQRAAKASRVRPLMVNVELEIYLTDFENRTFVGENAKNRDFCSGKTLNARHVYRSSINYIPALRKCAECHPGNAKGVVRDRSKLNAQFFKIPDKAQAPFRDDDTALAPAPTLRQSAEIRHLSLAGTERMVRAGIRVFLAAWLLAFAGHTASAAKRMALVIGNGAYANAPTLANPRNDAEDMAAALKALGFTVILGIDLDKRTMDRKILEFAGALSGADAGVFHYSGHGLQVAGVNYLVPVDAALETAAALDFEAVRLDLVQRTMEREAKTNILFLDACRNNPLMRNLARALGTRSVDIGRGLAPVESGAGTLISFSTQPGNVALDGDGRNSPYSGPLVNAIGTPGEDVLSMLTGVRNAVMTATGEKQVPWDNNALRAKFYFNPAAPATQQPQPSLSEEEEEWAAVQLTHQDDHVEYFIHRFPNSVHASAAKAYLEELRKRPGFVYNKETALQPQPSMCADHHGDYVVVNVKWGDPDGGLIISNGPGMNAQRLGVIPLTGGGVEIFECQGIWCRVRYICQEGWSSKLYLTARSQVLHHVVGVQANDPEGLNVRSGPGFSYPQSGSIPFNAADVVKHSCQPSPVDGSSWCLVSRGTLSGWVAGRFLVR